MELRLGVADLRVGRRLEAGGGRQEAGGRRQEAGGTGASKQPVWSQWDVWLLRRLSLAVRNISSKHNNNTFLASLEKKYKILLGGLGRQSSDPYIGLHPPGGRRWVARGSGLAVTLVVGGFRYFY